MSHIAVESKSQSLVFEKLIDFILYLGTFTGINLIAGSVIHILEYSVYNYLLMIVGMVLTPTFILLRDILIDKKSIQAGFFGKFIITLISSVMAGCITGGISHFEQNTQYALYLIISGFVMSFTTTLLYTQKPIKTAILDYFLWIGTFSGMSLISGTVVHMQNEWFTNWWLMLVGAVLTPITIVVREKIIFKRKVENLVQKFILLFLLSFGVGAFAGGIVHININTTYSIGLLIIGFTVGLLAAMMNKNGSLTDLRNI